MIKEKDIIRYEIFEYSNGANELRGVYIDENGKERRLSVLNMTGLPKNECDIIIENLKNFLNKSKKKRKFFGLFKNKK